MTTLELEDTYGYLEVAVRTAAGPAAVRLDLFELNNTYAALSLQHADDPLALASAWCQFLATRGLPPLSHGAGFRVAAEAARLVGELKKKDLGSPPPDSPGSTGSTSPDCPPGGS